MERHNGTHRSGAEPLGSSANGQQNALQTVPDLEERQGQKQRPDT